MQGKLEEADPLIARAAVLAEKALGPEDRRLADLLNKKAELLRKQVQMACVQSVDELAAHASPTQRS